MNETNEKKNVGKSTGTSGRYRKDPRQENGGSQNDGRDQKGIGKACGTKDRAEAHGYRSRSQNKKLYPQKKHRRKK